MKHVADVADIEIGLRVRIDYLLNRDVSQFKEIWAHFGTDIV